MASEAAEAAAAAARRADPVPQIVLTSQRVGHCAECNTVFVYGHPTRIGNLDPCPGCGDQYWEKWGYLTPDGELIPKGEAGND